MACYLRNYCGDFLFQEEFVVFYKKASNPAKINAWEKIFQIKIKHIPFVAMIFCICDC